MNTRPGGRSLLSPRDGSKAVSPVELFFDLVFVFAIAQLSHALLNDLSFVGALKTLILFIAVWWVWIYTTWVTNWLETHRTAVRLMLFALMLAGLVLSTSIPTAYGERGIYFAVAYVIMQVGRSLFMLWALAGQSPANYRNFVRITIWLLAAAPFWIAGGLADSDYRWALWTIALITEFVSPIVGFHVPGMGRSTTADWDVSGPHIAERCGLFVIIALGEMIMLAGATFAGLDWERSEIIVFSMSVIESIAMWWIYFNIGSERAAHYFEQSEDPGGVARVAYTYIHLPIICGIVATAAGIELLLAHPTGHLTGSTIVVVTGAVAIFLVGELLFKKVTAGWAPLSHVVGLAAVIVLAFVAHNLNPVQLVSASTLLLVTVAAWETISLRSTRETQRQE